MNRLSIRWLLALVAAVSLLVPFIAIVSLRSFDSVLARQTESELLAQGAVIASTYQQAWSHLNGVAPGNPRPRAQLSDSFTPNEPLLYDLDRVSPPFPETLPSRALDARESALSEPLSAILRNAQPYNLSGVRILAPDGCTIASSRSQIGSCFFALPEVKAAMSGQPSAALRARNSDEPTPPLNSFRRRGDIRVFVARPVSDDGNVIGVVLLSRTAESGLEWLFKRRKGVLIFTFATVALAILISFAFSWSITRPLSKMIRLLEGTTQGQALSSVRAPREIHALGAALDARAEQLERKNRYIADFAANVSHELKTPLTSIRGAGELLQESGERMEAEQRGRFLANILQAVDRTEKLVTRLLYLARLESPLPDEDEETIFVSNYAQTLRARWGDEVSVRVVGNDRRTNKSSLEAVIGNLVENALRYRRRKPVMLGVHIPPSDDAPLHIVVEDDGPGISPENQARVFDRFFTTERDRGGTGLGLSIVDATARRRGGRVELKSSPQGTRAEVWM